MKDILLSVRPKWCEKIVRGKKTIEVRKFAPKEAPFKAYIYCSYGNDKENYMLGGCGKVICEFICDKVYEWECKNRLELVGELGLPTWRASYMVFVDDLEKTCLTYDDLWEYGKGKTLYGWHISDLKIYDKPRELSEFRKPCPYGDMPCGVCEYYSDYAGKCQNIVTRPPQSWCYVEEEK